MIFNPTKLEAVKESMNEIGVTGMTGYKCYGLRCSERP